MGIYSTPPSDSHAGADPFVPGAAPNAGPYDKPEGSQRYSTSEETLPSISGNETLYLDVDDPEYAYATAPLENEGYREYADLAGTDFDEQDDYIAIPEGGM